MMSWIRRNGYLLLRWAIAIACFVFLGVKLADSGREFSSLPELFSVQENTFMLIAVIVLMFLNWAIEALKWYLGAKEIENISFGNAAGSVLAGLAVSMVGPNRTGEFLGRITALSPDNRIAGSFVSIHITLAQTIITLIAGFFSVAFADIKVLNFNYHFPVEIISSLVLSILLIWGYFRFAFIFNIVINSRLSKWMRGLKFSEVRLNNQKLIVNFILSAFRYAVFTVQFVILMKISGVALPMSELLISAVLIYFIMTAIPSFALADLGIRGTVSVFVAGLFAVSAGPFITASVLLWIINVAIPASVGAVVLVRGKQVC